MSVTLELHGVRAVITDGVWKSKDNTLKALCDLYMVDEPWTPQPSDPNPDYTVAVYVAKKSGAKIVSYEIPSSIPGRVY